MARPAAADTWFRSYVQTYIERDVRAVTGIRDLATFRRFLALVASRCGQLLNRTDIAAPLGVSVPTVSQWLGILEVTGLLLVVPPFVESFGKRLVKSPRIYFTDSGLACHLLGLESARALEASPFLGPLFEGFVAAEIAKLQAARGRRPELYHFRDQQGLEVDLVVPIGHRRLLLAEVKAGRTVRAADADRLRHLGQAAKRYEVTRVVVHRAPPGPARVVAPGVKAIGVDGLADLLR